MAIEAVESVVDQAAEIEMPKETVYDLASMGEGLVMKGRKTVELTPKFAAEFLDYPEFIVNDEKVDRARSDSHVVYLARAMQTGAFLWDQVNLVLCHLEGASKPTRLNGNHSSWARLVADEEGLDPKTRCPVQLMKYEAKTVEDMRRLYASLDRGRPRSAGVVINSYLAGTEEFEGISKGLLRKLAQGLGVWLWEEQNARTLHGSDDRAYILLKEHLKTAREVAKILQESQGKLGQHVSRAPVIGAMFATCKVAPNVAYEFWKDIREGLGINEKDDARYVLRNWLMQSTLAKSKLNGDLKAVTSEAMYRACIYKFLDFRLNKKVKNIKIDLSLNRPQAK